MAQLKEMTFCLIGDHSLSVWSYFVVGASKNIHSDCERKGEFSLFSCAEGVFGQEADDSIELSDIQRLLDVARRPERAPCLFG